jgi:DNA-binding transcriptional regulator YiaG
LVAFLFRTMRRYNLYLPAHDSVPNHPNRSRAASPAKNPKPEQVRAAREAAGLSQTAAAAIIHSTLRTWQDWEGGVARMHPAFWELFRIKISA